MRYCRRQLTMQKWNQEQWSLNKVYELILGAGVVFSKLHLNFLPLYISLDKVHGSPRFSKRSVSVCYSFTRDGAPESWSLFSWAAQIPQKILPISHMEVGTWQTALSEEEEKQVGRRRAGRVPLRAHRICGLLLNLLHFHATTPKTHWHQKSLDPLF